MGNKGAGSREKSKDADSVCVYATYAGFLSFQETNIQTNIFGFK